MVSRKREWVWTRLPLTPPNSPCHLRNSLPLKRCTNLPKTSLQFFHRFLFCSIFRHGQSVLSVRIMSRSHQGRLTLIKKYERCSGKLRSKTRASGQAATITCPAFHSRLSIRLEPTKNTFQNQTELFYSIDSYSSSYN